MVNLRKWVCPLVGVARVATLRSHKSSYDERSAAQRVVNIPSVRPRRQVGLSMAFSVTGPREEPVEWLAAEKTMLPLVDR